jgi:uncharacterized membrane protein YuzA (DUF378 family)
LARPPRALYGTLRFMAPPLLRKRLVHFEEVQLMTVLDRIALLLVIVGAVNWGLVGAFQFDLVAAIFGGQNAPLARIVYVLVGLAGLYCITFFLKRFDTVRTTTGRPIA